MNTWTLLTCIHTQHLVSNPCRSPLFSWSVEGVLVQLYMPNTTVIVHAVSCSQCSNMTIYRLLYKHQWTWYYYEELGLSEQPTWFCTALLAFPKCATRWLLWCMVCCSASNLAFIWQTSFRLSSSFFSNCRHWVHIGICWWLVVEEGVL